MNILCTLRDESQKLYLGLGIAWISGLRYEKSVDYCPKTVDKKMALVVIKKALNKFSDYHENIIVYKI